MTHFRMNLLQIRRESNWRARCKNGLSDNFGPTFTKPPNYLLSCNVTVAKWITSCSQHIVLVIWIKFPPKLYQVTLLLAKKVKLPKCQEIPIICAGGKKQFCCCPWRMWLKKKKKSQTWLAAMDYLDRKSCFRNFLHSKMANFVLLVTLLSHLFRLATPFPPGSASWSATTETKTNKQKCLRKVLTQQQKQENGHLPP